MTDMIVEIMAEVLTILGIATKEVKRGPLSELISRVFAFLTDRLIRKVHEEVGGEQRHRG